MTQIYAVMFSETQLVRGSYYRDMVKKRIIKLSFLTRQEIIIRILKLHLFIGLGGALMP